MNIDLFDYMQPRLRENQFIQYIGLVLDDIETGFAQMHIDIKNHHMQHTGFTHGGVTATICDVVTGISAYTTAPKGLNVVTVDLKVSYVNPSTAPTIKAIGRVKKSGKSLIFCEGEVFDVFENGDEKLVATCVSIMAAVDIPTVSAK